IRDGLGQRSVSYQVGDPQVFENDRVVGRTSDNATLWSKSRRWRCTFWCFFARIVRALFRRLLPFLRLDTRCCAFLRCFLARRERRGFSTLSTSAVISKTLRRTSMPISWPVKGSGWRGDVITRETNIPAIGLPTDRHRFDRAHYGARPAHGNALNLGQDK